MAGVTVTRELMVNKNRSAEVFLERIKKKKLIWFVQYIATVWLPAVIERTNKAEEDIVSLSADYSTAWTECFIM